jgi:hypothetical protein
MMVTFIKNKIIINFYHSNHNKNFKSVYRKSVIFFELFTHTNIEHKYIDHSIIYSY